MTKQELKSFNKPYLFKLKTLMLSCIFIFCFEGIADPYEETFSNLTRTDSVTTPEGYSVRSSVWKISIPGRKGTGFFIAPNKFITNFHVISSLLQHILKFEEIALSQEENTRTLKIKGILAVSALHDLALLETTESVDHYLPIRQESLQEQEDLFITGYPGRKLTDIRKTSDSIMFSRDTTSFFVNNSSLGGASGSPVVDVKKQVVGVVYVAASNLINSVNLNDLQVFVQEGLKNTPRDNMKQVVKIEIENLRNLAEQGRLASAQFNLGWMYHKGYGVTQNFEMAAHWYTKAAIQGATNAQANLGRMYIQGQGVTQNFEMAAHWYTKATIQGDVVAQANLGVMYTQGQGVTQNFEIAAEWFTQAAQQGIANAQANLGGMYYKGLGVTQNFEKAAHWYTKAAIQGDADSQFNLGVMYTQGLGVTQNFEMAAHWYTKAAMQEDAKAQVNLGWIYYDGQGVTQSFEMAAHWYTKAAMQGYAPAQFNLGGMYYKGLGVTQNFKIAVDWWFQAAMRGDAKAQFNLGWMYHKGQGVTQNFEIAAHWYTKAAQQGDADSQAMLEDILTNM